MVSKRIKVVFVAFIIGCIGISITSCATKTSSDLGSKNDKQEIASSTSQVNEKKVVNSWDEYNSTNLPIISAIPEKNVYLYGIKEKGVVLYIDNQGHYYPWSYLTPRFILPRMYFGDFDSDGNNELAIIIYDGSGTQLSIEELHIIEISGNEFLSTDANSEYVTNPDYFADRYYQSDDYKAQLNKLIEIESHNSSGEIVSDIYVNNESYSINMKEWTDTLENRIVIGETVHFDVEAEKLHMIVSLGILGSKFATSHIIGELNTEVNYDGNMFTVNNVHFIQNKE